MADEELEYVPRRWRWLERIWGYSGTLAVVAVLGGTLGRGVMQVFHLGTLPAEVVCCAGMTNPAEPLPPQPIGVLGKGIAPAVSHVQMLKNSAGKVVEARFVDGEGKLCELPGSRVARQTVEYDDSGRVVRRVNLDAAGKPAADAAGVAVREFAYDGRGNLVRSAYRDSRGMPVIAHPPAIAEQRSIYDAQNRPLVVRNLGENGLSKPNSRGEETVVYDYDDETGMEIRRNHIHDLPANNDAGVAEQRITRDAAGREIRREWMDAAGNPVAFDGAVCEVREYPPDSRMMRYLRMDAAGNPVQTAGQWSEYLVRLTDRGLPEWECYAGADGLPRDNPAAGYAEKVSLYAANGDKNYEYFWRADGTHADCCEKRYADSPDGLPYCLKLWADGSSEVAPSDTSSFR